MRNLVVLLIVVLFVGCATVKDDWYAARRVNTVQSYLQFLEKHPKSKYAPRAKNKIQSLKDAAILKNAKSGNTEKVLELLNDGADINATDKFGNTPLHFAIRHKHQQVASVLIKNGANINAAGELGNTPLHLSVYTNQNDVTTLLNKSNANAEIHNKYGLLPNEMQQLPKVEELVISAAKLIDRSGKWTDRRKGRIVYDEIKKTKSEFVVNSIVLKVIYVKKYRLQVLLLAVKLGIPGSEKKLVDVLMDYGNKSMAEDFLNSGSNQLSSGGRSWANAHGYNVRTGPGSHRSSWGRF